MDKSTIISKIQKMIYNVRIQNYHIAGMEIREILQGFQEDSVICDAMNSKESIWSILVVQLYEALQAEDMILVADVMEENVMPELKRLIIYEDPEIFEDYSVENTASGYYTIKYLPENLYLHSNVNPMEEARILVERCFDPTQEKYAVWGCGLGYHIRQLYEMARGAISITVFDNEESIIKLAQKHGYMEEIPVDRITYLVDSTGEKFADYIGRYDTGILIHYPSVKKIENYKIRQIMQNFFAGWNGTIQYREELAVNFRSNIVNCKKYVDELKGSISNRETILVAAGPSLDHCLEYLQQQKNKKIIFAVTTVLKKLLEAGIVPDYAVVMDSQSRTYGHMRGIEDIDIPLIVDSTAYWEFAEKQWGEKYLVLQRDYEKAQTLAQKERKNTYETGGSVTTLALEILLRLGSSSIEMIGVDLAYPEGMSHAKNTMDERKRDTGSMIKIKSVSGGWVAADNLFIDYRKWIERKISQYPNIPVYNLSDCGAYIEGTQSIR